MGFCGKYCARGRESFDFLGSAHEIAAGELQYESPEANVEALTSLLKLVRDTNQISQNGDDDMNIIFLYL